MSSPLFKSNGWGKWHYKDCLYYKNSLTKIRKEEYAFIKKIIQYLKEIDDEKSKSLVLEWEKI